MAFTMFALKKFSTVSSGRFTVAVEEERIKFNFWVLGFED
jgi:hypothetical protein